MIAAMQELARRLGEAPRPAPPPDTLLEHLPRKPVWLTRRDPLIACWDVHPRVLTHGTLALGWVFMANNLLWKEGPVDAPAGVVYSFDPLVWRDPSVLARVGHQLFRFHEDASARLPAPRDPWQRRVMSDVYSGLERPFHEPVPPELCDGYGVYHGSVMVFRQHLPSRVLHDQLVPLLVLRDEAVKVPMIVPSFLWPPAILSRWAAEGA